MSGSDVFAVLNDIVGPQGVLTERSDLRGYDEDWRQLFNGRALCVVRPRDREAVAEVVRACRRLGLAIVPQGGNTGMSGGATPDASGRNVVLSLERMAAIRDVDAIGETMEVEAGCVLQVAQQAAEQQGLLLPISLASEGSARIGGIVSTNAGGTNVLRYGMTRNRVLGLEVVTADGEIVSALRRLRKDNAGYDWKQWFIGAEGTLGIVTAAVLQLVPLPRHRATALLALDTPHAALQLLRLARAELGEAVSTFELMSGDTLALVAKHFERPGPLTDSPWFVLLEATSSLAAVREALVELLGHSLELGIARDGVFAESERQARSLWELRELISEAEGREGRSIKHDVSVPVAAVPEFLEQAGAAVQRAFPEARVNAFGHLGDGNIHYNLIVPTSLDAHALNVLVHDLVVDLGGSISAEHGIGQYRVTELQRCRTAPEWQLGRRIKRALDPDGLFNPGKVYPRAPD